MRQIWVLNKETVLHHARKLREAGITPSEPAVLIRHIMRRRLRGKKNCVIMLTGDNGDGKSYTALSLAEIIQSPKKFDASRQIIYNPAQYMEVMEYAFNNRDVKVVIFDEADKIVKARKWYDVVQQSIADIQSTFRQKKALVVIYVAPSWRRLDLDIRELFNFYGVCYRPIGHRVRLRLKGVGINRFNIIKPDPYFYNIYYIWMGKPKVLGGRRGGIIKISLPSKENIKVYEKFSKKWKTDIIRRKMKKIEEEIKNELAPYMSDENRVEEIIKSIMKNPEMLSVLVAHSGGKRGISVQKVSKLFNLSRSEAAELVLKLRDELSQRGIMV